MTGHQMQQQAREPTPEEVQARSNAMYALDQRIKHAFAQGREALWDAAAAMHEFDEQNGWTALSYDRLADWLADPEVSMTRRTYYRLISVYRETVLQRQIPVEEVKQLEMSKVDIVLTKVRTGETPIEEALADAQTMGARDLRREYYGEPEPEDSANVGTDSEPGTESKPALPTDGEPIQASEVEAEVEEDETAPKTPSTTSGAVSVFSLDELIPAVDAYLRRQDMADCTWSWLTDDDASYLKAALAEADE